MAGEIERIEIVHDGALDFIALNNAINDLRVGVNSLQATTDRIETQTTLTNGRVSALEVWRAATERAKAYAEGFRMGQMAVLGGVVTIASIVGGVIVKVIWGGGL